MPPVHGLPARVDDRSFKVAMAKTDIVYAVNASFILSNEGTLSYARVQGEKTRDSVDLRKCSIGRSKKRRHLVIDSGDRVPWHCKALSDKDFERSVMTRATSAVLLTHFLSTCITFALPIWRC